MPEPALTSDPILRTKIQAARLRPRQVPRPELVARLVAAEWQQLTLICAPAGFGKSTLLAQWASSSVSRFIWLTLDERDNSLERFLRYLVASAQMANAGLGETAQAILSAPQPIQAEAILTALINDFSESMTRYVWVLDDFHAIENPSVVAAVQYLVDHLPENLHLVIATRADPSLGLARLRARGELTELRSEELRFDLAETSEFLNAVMGLRLSTTDAETLAARTEGWIAGLQLVGLSLQGRPDSHAQIQNLAGSNRFILDYLMEEVLRRQSAAVQSFLLKTSILDRLTGGLCDAVTGENASQEMLEALEQANLFIQAQDDQRAWFRYHTLFLDLLRYQRERVFPGVEKELHRRAASWLEAHSMPEDAVSHWIAAGEIHEAARLAAVTAEEWLGSGKSNPVLGWLDSLPKAVRDASPRLHLVAAWASISLNSFTSVEDRLLAVEACLSTPAFDWDGIDPKEIAAEVLATRAIVSFTSGDLSRAVSLSQQALSELPEDHMLRASVWIGLGVAYRMSGDTHKAAEAFQQASDLSLKYRLNSMSISTTGSLADIHMDWGALREAERIYKRSLQICEQASPDLQPMATQAYVGLAQIEYERNHLDSARDNLQMASNLVKKWGNTDFQVIIHLRQAALALAEGRLDQIDETLAAADQLCSQNPGNPMIQSVMNGFRLHIWIQMGRYDQAWAWIQAHPLLPYAPLVSLYQPECLAYAETMIFQSQEAGESASRTAAREMLAQMEPVLQAGGFTALSNECALLLALEAYLAGQLEPAFARLSQLLSTTQPEGYIRLYLERGSLAAQLFTAFSNSPAYQQLPAEIRGYTDALLFSFDQLSIDHKALNPAGLARMSIFRNDPDQLTEREIEVLRWVVAGLSNQQIAEQLFLAPGTVKRHLHNIYEKLNVNSRAQAIARARDMGIA